MGRSQAPRRGSMQFHPRSRADRIYPRIRIWPESAEAKLLGFAGYKAGMTHTFILDTHKDSPTTNQEVFTPVTVLECPPLSIFGVRCYEKTPYGKILASEFWAEKLPENLSRALSVPKKPQTSSLTPQAPFSDVRVIVSTKPDSIDLKKTPEVFEIAVGGKTPEDKLNHAKTLLGKELRVSELMKDGEIVDVISVTKGKGFQGPIKRFGARLMKRKNSRSLIERHIVSIGDRSTCVRPTVPMAGPVGENTRTEFNKMIVKIGKAGDQITPAGGFLNYGEVKNDFVLIKGSVPGPAKRLVRLKYSIRAAHIKPQKPNVTYISLASKQGK